MICAGIDAGSRAIKIVLIDATSPQVIAKGLADQGVEQDKLASELFESVLKSKAINKKDVAAIVATGYGRNAVSIADTTITEITCHAVGVRQLVPKAMTVIDIGGQDSKLLRLDTSGKVRDFAMNDRCAAGTGRFLEIVAQQIIDTIKNIQTRQQMASGFIMKPLYLCHLNLRWFDRDVSRV